MRTPKLFTPGPTNVPPEILATQARPLIHHRTEEFRNALIEATKGLQYILRTDGPVPILACSGTGGMEAAVVNLTKPGDTVIVTEVGKFSERWREIAEVYGMKAVSVKCEPGEIVSPDEVARAFKANPNATALLTTHSETSTGVLLDVKEMAKVARAHKALVVVDAITSAGCHDVRTDEWGLDAVVGGSQKGVMLPPGLAYVALSARALARMREKRHGVYYLDLARAVKQAETGDTPWTPATTLVLALRSALDMMRAEGIERIVARHDRNARGVRAAVEAMGLKRVAKVPSNATTAVWTPGDSAGAISKHLETRYGCKIAGGQGSLKGKIVRIGHLGAYYEDDMYQMITALEATLNDLGLAQTFGRGVEALRAVYAEHTAAASGAKR